MRRLAGMLAIPPLLLGAAACNTGSEGAVPVAAKLRLGYFANVTHATAVAGMRDFIPTHIGEGTVVESQIFNAGPAVIEALFAGSLDAAYIGPSPTINAYVKSKGDALRIVAGATSGGASLVVRKDIDSATELKGRTLATPQLGGTQDVALRAWLRKNGLRTDTSGRGEVTIVPGENATTLQLFRDGRIDGAWLPEPWASRLVVEAGGRVLVDERTLWPDGRFATTHLVVATKYLKKYQRTVQALIEGHLDTQDWLVANRGKALQRLDEELFRLTSTRLPRAVLTRAYDQITLTHDPLAGSLAASAAHAVEAGLLGKAKLDGIYDLRLLNKVLAAMGKPPVSAHGLGKD